MFNKRHLVFTLALLVAVALALIFCASGPHELEYRGRRLREWVGELQYPSFTGEHREAAKALREIGTNAVPWLIGELRAKDSLLTVKLRTLLQRQTWLKIRLREAASRRRLAALACRQLGPAAKQAIPALTENLQIVDASDPFNVPLALAAIGAESLPALVGALTNQEERVRYAASAALGELRAPAQPAVPMLVAMLTDKNETVRLYAARSLGMIGGNGQQAVPGLIHCLGDGSPPVRRQAATALGAFPLEGTAAVPRLTELLNDQDHEVRRCASVTLARIDPQASLVASAVPAMVNAFLDGDRPTRVALAEAFASLGPQANPAVPILISALTDDDPEVRLAAARALKRIDPEAAVNAGVK
jgi:HEAT repeat protein